MSIVFWSRNREFRELSNFHEVPMEIDGQQWRSVEHYYQAQKFAGSPMEEAIRNAPSPKTARDLGRTQSPFFVDDWDSQRLVVMEKALRAKFTQNQILRRFLLSTGDEELIHRSHHDTFWGVTSQSKGENVLGRLLMKVRKSLRQAEDSVGQ